MIIKYTGKARKRVEGFGYMHKGEEKDFPEAIGKQLRKLPDFKEVRTKPEPPAPAKKKSPAQAEGGTES